MSYTDQPPMDPQTDEADDRQLELALGQGDAYRAAAEHMINEVAQTGGIQRAGDVYVGFAVEEAEGMYVVRDGVPEWQEPDEENIQIEVAPATFPRHDEVNGRRFGEPVSVSFPDVEFETGQD